MMRTETFPNVRLYQFGYSTIFAKDLSPAELLSRAAGILVQPVAVSRAEAETITVLGEGITADDLPHLDPDALHEAGLLGGDVTLLRAGTHAGWSFAVETEGTYLAADEILARVSRGTAALSLRESESGSSWIAYAEDGDILSSFDPLYPNNDFGKGPARLEQLTGHREAIASGERADAFANATRAVQQELGCSVPAEVDADQMLAIGISYGG
ncbi:DUF6461 domain-containing protein [Streptomyces sp. Ag109_O5-10]|uniref:DUF6461 domain-containing protein n=1 Tax=Streptomyces sp. Ag109_O5-10 TaxID=1855349 RepID=UPI001C434249|nr:DUF6461 domain-containing protein [Streptomyces sp. Ag109_O5-10]